MMMWRNISIALALMCCLLWWRNCSRKATAPSVERCQKVLDDHASSSASASASSDTPSSDDDTASAQAGKQPSLPDGPKSGRTFKSHGFALSIPDWAMRLGKQPGESWNQYRERMTPMAMAAVNVHRSRVARGRDDFANAAQLDSGQRAALDTAVQDAASQIQNRMFQAYGEGEFSPATFKPMTGVTLARDVLDAVDQANKRFIGSLREDQKAKLSQHPFDLADYLVFSTKWEEAVGL